MKFINHSIFIITILFLGCQNHDIIIKVNNLRCDNRINPIGIDDTIPKLSWNLSSSQRNKKQSAYQILVSGSEKALAQNVGNYWDTGKILSDRSIQINYEGNTLSSESICFWKVRVWDEKGDSSNWSNIGRWEMGLLSKDDWIADWINDGKIGPQKLDEFYAEDPAPLFRYDFNVDKRISRARLYITGLGYYDATINGQSIGDFVLDPGWTNYSKRVLYSTYDVSELLQEGGNCIGVILGNGWYNPLPMTMWGYLNLREHLTIGRPQFIAQLKIIYSDGTIQSVISNDGWKTHESPILRNNIYLGEVYDARKEIPGWNKHGFVDTDWNNAVSSSDKVGTLSAQNQPPIEITGKLKPIKLTEPKPSIYIFDMGQNFSGWIKFKVKGPAGTKIKIRYGELLYEDGTLNAMTSVAGQIKGINKEGLLRGGPFSPDTAWQGDTYITKGEGLEFYTPRFTFHAFRYVEVIGYPGEPELDALEGLRLNSNLNKTGSFKCSNTLFNDIQNITEHTFLSNVLSVQSDCPHRERFGYGGDIVATTDAFIYNFDMTNFYSKVVRDFSEAILPDGRLTDTAPFVGIDYCGIGWALAHPLLLVELYKYYGDVSLIEDQYETARLWFENVISKNELIVTEGLSDHESLAPIPTSEMVTPIYYQSAKIMSKLAEIVQRTEDSERYKILSHQIRQAYLELYLEKGKGKFSPNTQGSQSFALYTGISPREEAEAAISELISKIDDNNGHLTTGIFGTKYSLDVLSKFGHAEIVSNMVAQKSYPGWGYMLEKGATTLWEHWEFSDNTYSHNHPMFGSVSEWFYKWVAGIQADSSAIGFDKIIIRPQLVSNVNWVKAHYNSIHGKIVSEWENVSGSFTLKITIPVNSVATVYIPTSDNSKIKEGGTDISNIKDIQFVKIKNGCAIYKVGSGNYSFESELNKNNI